MLATLAIIAALLAVPEQVLTPHQIKIACAIVGVFGLLVTGVKVYSAYKRNMARSLLADLLEKGRAITEKTFAPVDAAIDKEAKTWANSVEVVLGKYLDKTYIVRFRVEVQRNAMDAFSGARPEWFKWDEIQMRVREVEKFITEI